MQSFLYIQTLVLNQFVYNQVMIGFIVLTTLLCSQVVLSQNAPYTKVVHNFDPNARCLDGSPAAMYLSQGDPKNILFYFMGGAHCGDLSVSSTLQSCYQRSKNYLGSSLIYPKTTPLNGILSNDPNKNIFANWTKAFFIYCDGAFHQGNALSPIKYKDTELFFRGSVITRAHFAYLNSRYPFEKAQNVIITGSSAGGMAAYIWTDYLKTLLKNPATKYFSIPDSSIFLNPSFPIELQKQHNMQKQADVDPVQVLLTLSNKDQSVPNQDCLKQIGKENEFHCLSIQYAYRFLKTQALFIQSSYDQYVIQYEAFLGCLTRGLSGYSLKNCSPEQMKIIEDYRQYYLGFLQKLLSKGHNVWSISCSWHAVIQQDQFYSSPLEKIPEKTGKTMQDAVHDFVIKRQKVLSIDYQPWPSNSACAY